MYTREEEKIIAQMSSTSTVEDIALTLDRSVRSVRSKMTTMGLYKKQPYLSKRGEPPRKKEEFIDSLAELLNVDAERLNSLEKVNKSVLVLLERALQD